MTAQGLARFQTAATAFGLLLALIAIWIILPELIRPGIPATALRGPQLASAQERAQLAAIIGFLRGDLWSDDALLAAGVSRDGSDLPAVAPEARDGAREAAEQALTAAPNDARTWLLLAMLYPPGAASNGKIASALKMSYYTAPNDTGIMPRRLMAVAHAATLSDRDLQGLLDHEIGLILSHRPELKPAIAAAYRAATPAAREAFDTILKSADPNFLKSLAAGAS